MAARKLFYVCAGPVCLALALLSAPQSAHADDYVYLTQWGTPGIGDGEFNGPYGMAVDASGNVYVAEWNNHRIQKFTSTGTYLTQWGSLGSGDGQFTSPSGVAVDASGNVYVVDNGNYRIQKFTSTGTYLTQWGSFGGGDGQFSLPTGVAVDASGNVYVSDRNIYRVQKFTSTGAYLAQWGAVDPVGVAVSADGNVFVPYATGQGIQMFTSTGTLLTSWHVAGPHGVAVNASGGVYVSGPDAIQKFTGGGTYLTQFGSYGSGDGQFAGAFYMAVDASGNVYVADFGNHRIVKFGPASGVGVPGESPLAFALDPVRPNPARGGTLAVQFTLPSAAAASLELLDVAGRRISAREVGQLGAGRHALDFGTGRLAPGIYVVRLQQGANVKVVRAAVLGVR